MTDLFKAELRRIVRGEQALAIVELTHPASHGWMRRPEFDRPGLRAWERPDGTVLAIRADGERQGSGTGTA